MARIGVLSDTHNDCVATEEAIRLLDAAGATSFIHCGDVGPDVFRVLPSGRTHAVAGNTDDEWLCARMAAQCDITWHQRFGRLPIGAIRVAFLHSDDRRAYYSALSSGDFDLVLCGHTHVAEDTMVDDVRVVNPGAVVRSCQPSVAIVDVPEEIPDSGLAASSPTRSRASLVVVQPICLCESSLTPEQERQNRDATAQALVPLALRRSGLLS